MLFLGIVPHATGDGEHVKTVRFPLRMEPIVKVEEWYGRG
jgi:hypothetical protein